jgi:FKBP-type peptidyl-prolyl cis-trans isomerase
MTTATAPFRSTLLTAIGIAVSVSLVVSAGARGQADGSNRKTMTKTASGLQYFDEKEGTGDTPKTKQTCVMHYTGWLWENNAKGKEFDSSRKRGEPFSFAVGTGQVIKGWDEGVATMKVGGKRDLLIPADLGYGDRGASGTIPPNATLFFEVELLGVMQKTDSGLEYRDVKEGDGPTPRQGQTCVVHYTGWLWSYGKGRKFDSSKDRGQPFSFPIGRRRVIQGWDEGVSTMKVGGKRELIIPAELGYGARGYPPDIPANATLFFEVELLGVK